MSSQSLHVQFAESLATPPSDRPRMDGPRCTRKYPGVAQQKGTGDRVFLLDVYWVARRDDDIKQDTTPETEQVVPPMSFSETLKERLALTYEVTVEEAPRQEQPETESDSEQSSWGRHGTEHLSVIMPSTCSSSGSSEAGSYPVTPADDEKPQYLGGACNKSQQSSRTLSF